MTVYLITTDQEDRAFEVETFCCLSALRDEFAQDINEQLDYAEQVGYEKAEQACADMTSDELANVRRHYAEQGAGCTGEGRVR